MARWTSSRSDMAASLHAPLRRSGKIWVVEGREAGVNQGAQRYLAERLSNARSRLEGIELIEWRRQMLPGFGGALEALRAADILTSEEVSDWTNRMLVALGLEPLEPSPPGSQRGRAISIGEGEPPLRPTAPPLSRFLELIPVKDADQPVPFGGRVQILGIERYDSRVAVAWRLAPLPDPEVQFAQELSDHERDTEGLPNDERRMMRHQLVGQLRAPGRELGLSDDVETTYRRARGGAGGSDREFTGRAQFVPAIPEAASTLTVHWGDLRFPVSLR
jgi:hypothetical protein